MGNLALAVLEDVHPLHGLALPEELEPRVDLQRNLMVKFDSQISARNLTAPWRLWVVGYEHV